MRRLTHLSIILGIVLSGACEARAQTEPKAKAIGSISGNVTISGKPARGMKVIILQGSGRYERKAVATARTDANGHYQLSNIPVGNCIVSVDAPTFASELDGDDSIAASKTIKLEEGENVEGIDLQVAPGAVITGRVMTSRFGAGPAILQFGIQVPSRIAILQDRPQSIFPAGF